MKRKRKNHGSDDGGLPLSPAALKMFEATAKMRASIADARIHMTRDGVPVLDFDGYESRLDEIERLVGRGTREDWRLAAEMRENLSLDMEADTAAFLAGATERIVRFADLVARRAEEKKYELSEEQREGLDSILLPYREGIREEMLSSLPIEARRKLEEEGRA